MLCRCFYRSRYHVFIYCSLISIATFVDCFLFLFLFTPSARLHLISVIRSRKWVLLEWVFVTQYKPVSVRLNGASLIIDIELWRSAKEPNVSIDDLEIRIPFDGHGFCCFCFTPQQCSMGVDEEHVGLLELKMSVFYF